MLYLKNVRVMNQKLRIRKVGCTLHMSTLYMYIQYHPKHFYTHCNVAGMSCILPPIPGDGPSGPNFFPTQVCLAVGFLGMLRPRPRNGFPDAWDFYTLFSQKHIDGILVVSRYPIMAICMLTRPYIYIYSMQFPHLINGDGICLATILNLECRIARCFAMAGRTAIETKVHPACHRIKSLMV